MAIWLGRPLVQTQFPKFADLANFMSYILPTEHLLCITTNKIYPNILLTNILQLITHGRVEQIPVLGSRADSGFSK